MDRYFLGHGRPTEEIKDVLHRAIQLGVDFKCRDKVKAIPDQTPASKSFDEMPSTGISYDELLAEFEGIAAASSNWGSPNFMGFPDAANNVAALTAAVFTPLLNQNMANQDICAPIATFMEMEVVHWLRQQLGYAVPDVYSASREIGGTLTLGGCLSNTIALMAAREQAFPNSKMTGLPVPGKDLLVLVPDVIEHYSVRSAMAWLSLGEANVGRVPVDDQFRIILPELEAMIDRERARGKHVMACVAYAGDSRSMRIDDLGGIADVLQRKKVWFHVDACHGSQLAFSNTHRHKLAGIEKADSVTIDPHKVLCIPYNCSFVLFKNPSSLSDISTNSDLILKTQWSLGQITPCIGSKAFDALKVWSTVRLFGREGIGAMIDKRLELTGQIQTEIRARKDLVLLNETDINSCMFMFVPGACQELVEKTGSKLSSADLEKLNELNLAIKTKLTKAGDSYVHGFNLKRYVHALFNSNEQVYVLRTMNGNPLTTMEHVNSLLDSVEELGRNFFKERQFHVPPQNFTDLLELPVCHKLQDRIQAFFGSSQYQAILYGSNSCRRNKILADLDLMVFTPDNYAITSESKANFEALFRDVMGSEGIAIDAEIPFHRKQLVPISFAEQAASGAGLRFEDGDIAPIIKTTEYLASDEMLQRLIFNVLTVPNVQIAGGSLDLIATARDTAQKTLIDLMRQVSSDAELDCDGFIRTALSHGTRSGEEWLGYKERPGILSHLRNIWDRNHAPPTTTTNGHANGKKPTPKTDEGRVIFLNGFPGVGKFAISKVLAAKIPTDDRLLLDNHLLIDPVNAIVPGRGKSHKDLRQKFRQVAFDALKEDLNSNLTLIMTGCVGDNAGDASVYAEHVDIARARNVPFVSVNLVCDREDHQRRFGDPARYKDGKSKLQDARVLEQLLSNHKLLDPTEQPSGWLRDAEADIRHFEVDTTGLSAEDSALKILDLARAQ